MTTIPYQAALYLNQMIEVKRRLCAIDRTLGAKKPRTLDEDTDSEFMWLQVRKIIELVTYSAIASDLERYSAFRAQSKGDVQNDQKANKMLPWLAGVNPRFMPFAMGDTIVTDDGVKSLGWNVDEAQQATLDRLTACFNEASNYLHIANPFQPDAQREQTELWKLARQRVTETGAFLKGLLWSHYKLGLDFKSGDDPKSLSAPTNIYIIEMGKPTVREVYMATAIPKDQPA